MLPGWLKLHRKLYDKSFFKKDSEKVHLWILLLFKANFFEREESLGGKPFICKPGQFTTGRRQLAEESGIAESKIERMLTYFEKIEQQIEQQKTSTNRLITILKWEEYQQSEQQIEQQVNNDRTTSEQQVNTLIRSKEVKEDKKNKETTKPPLPPKGEYAEIVSYLNQKTGKNFSSTNKKTVAFIKARFNEGRTTDDFIHVIDIKCAKWLSDPKMIDFLRPETLFGNKFESYLNEQKAERHSGIKKWLEIKTKQMEGDKGDDGKGLITL